MDKSTPTDSFAPGNTLAKGVYRRGGPSDLRSPCPMMNCLANHGYLPRDGRNVYQHEMYAGVKMVGLSTALAACFSAAPFFERKTQSSSKPQQNKSVIGKIWALICNPLAVILSKYGMRPHGQVDSEGKPYVNLDQLALPNTVEHDISLTRLDFAQGDNCSPQKDLIDGLLACSSDGNQYVTLEDLVKFRAQRIETQRRENDSLNYGPLQHKLGCAETALILNVLGDGKKVRWDVLRSFFAEERLPLKEGWKGERWWTFGLLDVQWAAYKIVSFSGMKF